MKKRIEMMPSGKTDKYFRYLGTAVLLIVLCAASRTVSAVNADSLFERARVLAQAGDRQEAISLCHQILEIKPNYHDVRVYLGRVLAWEKRYSESLAELRQVLTHRGDHREALDAIIDVESWSGRTDEALLYARHALNYYPNDERFLFKTARLLIKKGDFAEAAHLLNLLLEINPGHSEARNLMEQIRYDRQLNKVAVKYDYDSFDRGASVYGPWHLSSLELARRTEIGSMFLRFNYANRKLGSTPRSGFQLESDAYPRIAPGMYAYLNAGYSPDPVFPEWRLGGDLYRNLFSGFELSLGLRYLQFTSTRVTIYTFSLGKYYRNYWFSFRPYISHKDAGYSITGTFYIRLYQGRADNYLNLILGAGSTPVEVFYMEELQRLDSRKLKLEWQHLLNTSTIIRLGIGYEYEEYRVNTFGKRYSFSIDLYYLF